MDYGKNLVWFLHEVSVSGLEQLEDGYVEIVTESDTGGIAPVILKLQM